MSSGRSLAPIGRSLDCECRDTRACHCESSCAGAQDKRLNDWRFDAVAEKLSKTLRQFGATERDCKKSRRRPIPCAMTGEADQNLRALGVFRVSEVDCL
jgi:hypothetical protein